VSILGNYATFRWYFGTATIAPDGMKTFNSANVIDNIQPFTSWNFSFPVSIDLAGADDAVTGTDEWHWYLQEARETQPLFQLSRDDRGGTTRSGRVSLELTAYGTTAHTIHDWGKLNVMLRGAYLFAFQVAGSRIFTCDLHGAAFASGAQ